MQKTAEAHWLMMKTSTISKQKTVIISSGAGAEQNRTKSTMNIGLHLNDHTISHFSSLLQSAGLFLFSKTVGKPHKFIEVMDEMRLRSIEEQYFNLLEAGAAVLPITSADQPSSSPIYPQLYSDTSSTQDRGEN